MYSFSSWKDKSVWSKKTFHIFIIAPNASTGSDGKKLQWKTNLRIAVKWYTSHHTHTST